MKLQIKGNTFIATIDGEVYISNEITTSQLETLMSVDVTEAQVLEIFNPKLQEVKAFNKEVEAISNTLLESGLFEERNGSYYRLGLPYSVPKMLLEKYKSIIDSPNYGHDDFDNQLIALDNFWTKCCLNPSAETREDLFGFIQRGEFLITPKGYLVAARRLKKVSEENLDLVKFISESWLKIKGQKKAPRHYWVKKNTEGYYYDRQENVFLDDTSVTGNLQELYDNLAVYSENMFTDGHTGKMKITLGVPVPRMREEECNPDRNKTCDKGYHFTSLQYLNKHYYAGGEAVAVLINPMDVRAIPIDYDQQKGRCLQYYPFALLTLDEEGNYTYDADTSIIEDDYENVAIETLNKLLQEVDSSNQVIHKLEPISLTTTVFKTIDQYRETILDRVVKLYEEDFINDEDGDYDDDEYGYDYLDEEE